LIRISDILKKADKKRENSPDKYREKKSFPQPEQPRQSLHEYQKTNKKDQHMMQELLEHYENQP
jgi:hypothetical protein